MHVHFFGSLQYVIYGFVLQKSGACGVNQVNKQSSLNYHEKTSFQAAKFNAGTHTEAQKNCLDIEK